MSSKEQKETPVVQQQPSLLGSLMIHGGALVACAVVAWFFFIPAFLVIRNLRDPAIRTGEIPNEAWRLHRYLAPKYEEWARERIASKKAGTVYYLNVPGTEWPLFGSVFYLWATDHLQQAWEADHSLSKEAPVEYARDTIEACKDLLLDPVHHTWVVTHWGEDYMHTENVFFRSLLIAGLTSYERLVKSGEYVPLLKDQIDTLAKELDESPHGVLHDYPRECYPIDVFAAVAWIRRADEVTGTDHSEFVKRELRAFSGDHLDDRGLIPWFVNPWTGEQLKKNRGIVNSHILIFAPEIYSASATEWYQLFEKHFWQEKWYASGYREFYRDRPDSEWTYDVDSGPIIDGFSPSANAFGIASARVYGRMDQAYTLGAQVLAAAYPLPDGRLLGARLLSDMEHAPYLAETAILWQLTETPRKGVPIVQGGHLTGAIYIGLTFFLGLSLLVFLICFFRILRWHRRKRLGNFLWIPLQFMLWLIVSIVGLSLFTFHSYPLGAVAIVFLLASLFFPVIFIRRKAETTTATPQS